MSKILTHTEIMEQLPCVDRFILLDRVIFDSDTKIRGMKSVTMNEWYFQGHFPNHPIVPGVLQVESMAQLAELAVWKKLDPERKGDIYIKELNKVKFRRPSTPGDRILFDMEITGETSDSFTFSATARNNSGVACQAQLTLGVRPRVEMDIPQEFNQYDKSDACLMDVMKISSIIPHRYPFLFVDYVVKTEGSHTIAVKNATSEEPAFRRYDDHYSVLSGSVHPEIVAQAGAISMLSKEENKGKIALFMTIEHSESTETPVLPGDQMILEFDLPDTKSRVGKGEGILSVNGKLITQTQMMFAMVPA